jgi:mannitol/fructose-specific phosphotransferase system IIA component (Ntr-type)
MPTDTTDFWKLFKAKNCSIALKAPDQEGAFAELVDNLVSGGGLPKELRDLAVKALVDREQLASTGLGVNVAIPHVKLKGLEQAAVSLSIHKEGLEWKALDGELVHLFFTVLRPDRAGDLHDPERHLGMMKWVARLARDADFRRFAINASTKKELVDLLKEKAGA